VRIPLTQPLPLAGERSPILSSVHAVAPSPQCDSHERKIIGAPLPKRVAGPSLRALDAHPARETLMTVIMFNATTPVGCASDLALFRH
jgi:hypothetical protein